MISKSDIKEGSAKSYLIEETKVVVANIGGEYFAVEDICSHDDGELVSGECELINECQLQCPRHGAAFDVKNGSALKMPAVAPIRIFEVVDSGDSLEIKIED